MECIDTGWISSEGPFIRQFEESYAKRVDRKYGIAVANGSIALETSLIFTRIFAVFPFLLLSSLAKRKVIGLLVSTNIAVI